MNKRRDIGALRLYELLGGLLLWLLVSTGLLARLCRLAIRTLLPGISAARGLLLLNLAVNVLELALLLLLLRRYLADQLRRLRGQGRTLGKELWKNLLLYYLFQLLVSWAVTWISALCLPEYHNENQSLVSALVERWPGWGLLLVCLLAPTAEELLSRGVLFCGLYPRSRILAYALSMSAFAALHVAGYLGSQPPLLSLLNFIVYLTPGFFLARIYERCGSILAAVLLHALINACTMALQLI